MFDFWRINKKVRQGINYNITGKLSAKNMRKILGDSSDIIEKRIYVNNENNFDLVVFAIDGMIDTNIVDDYILKPLATEEVVSKAKSEKDLYQMVVDGILYHVDQDEVDTIDKAIENLLKGFTILIFNSIGKAISFDAKKLSGRSVDTPQNEGILKGSQEAFVENIRTNTSLVRKKIKVPNLRFKSMTVGKKTWTAVDVVYIEGVTDRDILDKVIKKIENLEADNLISSMAFSENMRDSKYSLFPQILSTERVDKFCANLVDGKVGIIIDGLALGYIAPGVFTMFLQAPEDYADNYFISSFIRILRYLCLIITLILPGFYIAITTFHQEMIPTNLLFSIINSKVGVPFPTVFSVLGMLIAFEILLEASLRLPKSIGATISIIGGLVVGEAAVSAKLISPAVVVAIAATGIAGFVIPSQYLSNALRICRLFLVLCASVAGLFGLSIGFIIIMYHLCSLEVFGVPYMVPYTSNEGKSLFRDTFVRLPENKENNDVQN